MNEKLKSVFEKIGLFVSAFGVFLLGLFFGKILHNNRNGTQPDTDGNSSFDDESRNADRISEEAGSAAQSIFDIIDRVKNRKSENANES